MATTRETLEGAVRALNNHDREGWLSLAAPDIVIQGGAARGTEALGMVFDGLHRAFPDLHVEVQQMVCEGELSMVMAVLTGTHTGPLSEPGIPELPEIAPTGSRYVSPFAWYARVVNGKQVEFALFYDRLSSLRQLGALGGLAAVQA